MLTAATATNTLISIIMLECKINTLFTHGHVIRPQIKPHTEKKFSDGQNKLFFSE